MTKIRTAIVAYALSILVGSFLVLATADAAKQAPQHPMSFFITSVGSGDGANLGGLAGADAICQARAAVVGAGNHTWHAYLSTQTANGRLAVNARDRIGNGPWYNAKGTLIAKDNSDLHGDTLDQARRGNGITKLNALTEKGEVIQGMGDPLNQHDILTGSKPAGTAYTDAADHTCNNWTSDSAGSAQLGHDDRNGSSISWNSAHPSRGCSQASLTRTGGAGLFYCFAIN